MQTLLLNRRPTQRLPARWPAVRFIVFRMANLQGNSANDSLYCGPELRYHLLDGERFSGLLIGRLGSGVVEMPHSWTTLPAARRMRCRSCPGSSVLASSGPFAITMSRRASCASRVYRHAHTQAAPAIPAIEDTNKSRRVTQITARQVRIESAWEQIAYFRAAPDSAVKAKISAHSLICTSLPLLVTGQMVQHDAVFTVSNED